MNLVVNARDAISMGGKITIETGNVYLDDDDVHHRPAMSPGAYAMLAVSDTGCGMDKETQARLFEPFFTTKETGDGELVGVLARDVLRDHGYVVLEANDGADAMGVAVSHRGPIHLMVTDVVMPNMGGREVAVALAPLLREMRGLYMSEDP